MLRFSFQQGARSLSYISDTTTAQIEANCVVLVNVWSILGPLSVLYLQRHYSVKMRVRNFCAQARLPVLVTFPITCSMHILP